MRSVTALMTTLLAATVVYSPTLLACANAMKDEALVSGTGRQVFFASVSGIALLAAGALYVFRFRSRSDG